MGERVSKICAALERCAVFADVGCDHGFMTRYMFRRKLCERAYITDISEGSVRKAARLLEREIAAGKCFPVVADGLDGIPERCDLVLIAGMGGEEIIKILRRSGLPQRFVLQPMKNSEKVRQYLLEQGAMLDLDYTFSEGEKFYDLIRGSGQGGDSYSPREIAYGRDNLNGKYPAEFLRKTEQEREKIMIRLTADMKEESRAALTEQLREREELIDELKRTL